MSRNILDYRQLKHKDYITLMQLLPRLRLDLERAQDSEGAKACFETTRRVGKRAKALIEEMTNDDKNITAK